MPNDALTEPLIVTDSQRLGGAKTAFRHRDPSESKLAHQRWEQNKSEVGAVHPEPQLSEGPLVKPMVFGGLDGVGTSFALLAGGVGTDLPFFKLLAMCSATIFASALSMGFGEYISGKAERDIALREKARERWEVDLYPEGEVAEMIDLYRRKGLTLEDAEKVATTLSKYVDFWVEHMMLHELNIVPPVENQDLCDSLQSSFVMFFSFAIFGMMPIIAYCVTVKFTNAVPETCFVLSALVAFLTLFALGGLKSYMADTNCLAGGAVMAMQGSVAGASAFIIGSYLGAE
eukprot:GEMP01049138.1.p1 GENE.GEMP01049138.1~~GEMP01049138.1.p1  ORF type:complete len:288 (+),score=64.64 GEMP01049138.1:190-1053(+)